MMEIVTLLYLFFLVIFAGGVFIVIYHLLTFGLNKSLAWFMTIFLAVGALVLVAINIFYFSRIDWQVIFSGNNFL